MKLFFTSLLFVLTLSAFAQKHYYLVAGTYTNGKSKGVYVYDFNTTDGSAREVSMTPSSNPAYVAMSPNEHYVYVVNENAKNGNGGEATAFSFNAKNGELKELDKEPSGGDNPCYISIDKTGKWAVIANYTSGT